MAVVRLAMEMDLDKVMDAYYQELKKRDIGDPYRGINIRAVESVIAWLKEGFYRV